MALWTDFSDFLSTRRLPSQLDLSLLAISTLLHFPISEAVFYEQLQPRTSITLPGQVANNAGTTLPSQMAHVVICDPEALLIFEAVGTSYLVLLWLVQAHLS